MGDLYNAIIVAESFSRVVIKYRFEGSQLCATVFQERAKKSEKSFPIETFLEDAKDAIIQAMQKKICLVIEHDVEWKLPKEEKENKTDKKKSLYVIAWDDVVLPGMRESLKPGEELVMRVCSDCLKVDNEIIPNKERWKYVVKGKKYICVGCDKEIIG